jgi:hypothetical protein
MSDYTIDIAGASTGDDLYCTTWEQVEVTYPKCLSPEQVVELMSKHPILAEVVEDEVDDISNGLVKGGSIAFSADKIPFDPDLDLTYWWKHFDNFEAECGWDGKNKVINVDGFIFHISQTGYNYTNIGVAY